MSDELIGQSLGQFQIRVLLGKGGMSTVYLAYQPSMDRTVAIKVLPREFLHDTTFLTRFQQEGRTIAKLEHLHILPVYDFGEHDGIPYIVMRYLAGGTLADLIFGRLPPLATTARLIGQVADALDYAHGRGIIHRDLKPSNVLLDNSGNAYLADFGIARVTQAVQAVNLTGSRVIGTPPYIAPEMVKKDQKVTPSVDIYALGIITFEMLTGQTPFYDEDSMKVLMAHVLEPVPSARAVDPNISQEIDAVVMRCLAKTPQQRFKTATDFATELAHVAATSAHSQSVSSASQPKPPDTPPRPRAQQQPDPLLSPAAPEGAFEGNQSSRGWLFALVAIGALIMGIVLIAFVLIGGNALGLTRMFGASRATPTPTVTPTPSSNSPTAIAMATILPPPSSGNRLVFTSTRDGDWDLYLIDSDGTNLRQVTDDPGIDYDPAWSPDGIRIAYASSTSDGKPEIKVITIACVLAEQNCDESAQNLTNNAAKDYGPAWSPDGQYIAFTSDREGNLDIYTMKADGTGVKRLTFNSGDDQAPRWSPDGTRIVYYAADGNLYVIAASGGLPQQLTDSPEIEKWPDWSPDSLFIAYTATSGQTGSRHGIFTIELATKTLAQLTSGSQDDDPAWSPDGMHIAYDADPEGDGDFDLVVLEITSGAQNQLTTEANNAAPDWQPQP
jgi:serine/threonine protein kinase